MSKWPNCDATQTRHVVPPTECIYQVSNWYLKACWRKVRKTRTDGRTDGRTDIATAWYVPFFKRAYKNKNNAWLQLSDAIWRCHQETRHYLNQCWLSIKYTLWHSLEVIFRRRVWEIYLQHMFWDNTFEITTTSRRGQFVDLWNNTAYASPVPEECTIVHCADYAYGVTSRRIAIITIKAGCSGLRHTRYIAAN